MTRARIHHAAAFAALVGLASGTVWAQDRIFRCGNEYTNNAQEATARGCKPVSGGSVTIVQSTPRPASAAPVKLASAGASSSAATAASPGGTKVDSADQRQRDSDARAILESELRKQEAKLTSLKSEYNNGEPERRGDERNYQKYLDRVAELKSSIARAEADLSSLRTEISRLK